MDVAVYLGLFGIAFAAATVLPLQSEAALVGLLLTGNHPAWLVVAVASAGNVLGSMTNWVLGRGIERLRGRRWFPVSDRQLDRAGRWYRRYGKWSLLMSWLPIIGDPLTVLAGVLREPFAIVLLLVTVAKVGRYVVVAAVTLGLFG